ncbi:hypothetical protein [PinkBerry-associated phage LS06-2018-MD08]|nr:hypothetical protein [PinkBerry-associated phage LS06-2018-MD08]
MSIVPLPYTILYHFQPYIITNVHNFYTTFAFILLISTKHLQYYYKLL